jgi:hypothetical protein
VSSALRLGRGNGKGHIKWDEWKQYTIIRAGDYRPEDVPSYSVLGSRFVRADTNFGVEDWAGRSKYTIQATGPVRQQLDMAR